MNVFYKAYCRIYQKIFKLAIKILPWRVPEIIEGEGRVGELAAIIKIKGFNRILIVTDKGISSLGLMNPLTDGLKEEEMFYTVYDETIPNPTIDNIEAGLKMYKENNCDAIVAFGGGSSMDCAKIIAARVVKPNKSVTKMKGLFKILKRIPPLFAVPTTSGTGSETTIAAVITDAKTHEKYPINDISLIPRYAILDPSLTLKLPKHITSTTGVDALTHAVEAYIGKSNSKLTVGMAESAVRIIFDNLKKAYDNGMNINARSNMQLAAYYAGIAFTRAYVGYVHAIAHALGGLYGTPHGLANAVILPYLLDWYGEKAYKPLAKLADLIEITEKEDSLKIKAEKFIAAVRELNAYMQIPANLPDIKDEDMELIAKRALKEGNPDYPVPKIMNFSDILGVIKKIKGE